MKLASILVLLSFCLAGSLWHDTNSSPYSPPVAHRIGDIVIIHVDENNTATQKAQTDLRKNTRIDGNTNLTWGSVASALSGSQSTEGKLGFSAQNNFTGTGTTGRSNRLQAQLTAQVYRVENDRLFIRGSKKIIINNEEEEFTIEGQIRSSDIAPDNSISSGLIAEAVLKIKGYGSVSTDQEKGFFARMIDWLF